MAVTDRRTKGPTRLGNEGQGVPVSAVRPGSVRADGFRARRPKIGNEQRRAPLPFRRSTPRSKKQVTKSGSWGSTQLRRVPSPAPGPGNRHECRGQQVLEIVAQPVAGAQPDEVKPLVHEDARKLGARAGDHHAPLPQKRSGMHRAARVVQSRHALNPNRSTRRGRQAAEQGRHAASQPGIARRRHHARRCRCRMFHASNTISIEACRPP